MLNTVERPHRSTGAIDALALSTPRINDATVLDRALRNGQSSSVLPRYASSCYLRAILDSLRYEMKASTTVDVIGPGLFGALNLV